MRLIIACIIAVIAIAQETDPNDDYPCMGRGYRDETSGNCMCINGFFGYKCQYKYCPFGTSWHSKPLTAHTRNVERVACSNAGDCNHDTGECECRPGYDGRACERMACPTRPMVRLSEAIDVLNREYDPDNVDPIPVTMGVGGTADGPFRLGSQIGSIQKTGLVPGLEAPCSGHGRCRTMYEASTMWDGRALRHPPVMYQGWEAEKMQGCLCDVGWEGFDCSFRSCPKGRDPLDPNNSNYQQEVYMLECQADAGYFAIDIFGGNTAPIPFDADYMYVKHVLEAIPGVGTVDVVMQEDSDGLARVCGDAKLLKTTFTLRDHPGQLAPARINTKLAGSRFQSESSTSLTSDGSAATIRFVSEYTLNCKHCDGCHGYINFAYGGSVSAGIEISTTGAASAISTAVESLTDLTNAGWVGLDVATTILGRDGNDKVCYGANNTAVIEVRSDYGNIPGLKLIDGSYKETSGYVSLGFGGASLGLTMTSNSGTGPVYECSNQGVCDRTTGTCLCMAIEDHEATDRHITLAKATASDPASLGGPGFVGDCGHMEHNLGTCGYNSGNDAITSCNGQGVCKSGRCVCYEGFSGMDCSIRQCPKAPAWFDEPSGAKTAHAEAECAGFGFCDRSKGKCICRDGYSGEACQIKDCPADPSTGEFCSGHGYCKSVRDIFALYGLEYGSAHTLNLDEPQTWDANMMHECLCASKYSAGEFGHPLVSPTDPKDWVGRYHVGARPIPGWTGYACQSRLCPRGDSKMTENSLRVDAVKKEKQRILCTLESGSFSMTFFGQKTPNIAYNADATTVKRVIESLNTVGNVTVTLETGNTACDTGHTSGTGLLVQFDTEGGNLPLSSVSGTDTTKITIEAAQDGTSENLECGGIGVGMCDRETGVCDCAPDRYSSDGAGGMGANGDCGHRPDRT